MKFHHVGYLTNNINKSIKEFTKINYKKKGNLYDDKKLLVKVQFIINSNNIIELVKPYKKNYNLQEFIKKNFFAYHFAYKVKNLNKAIKKLTINNFRLIVNPVPAKAFNNKNVAFLKMKNNFIIELVEE
tara:strand:+ start:1964 stop:2350 length:387 start_codon:yes stop_codon:yes gene_type:complete